MASSDVFARSVVMNPSACNASAVPRDCPTNIAPLKGRQWAATVRICICGVEKRRLTRCSCTSYLFLEDAAKKMVFSLWRS